MTDTADFFRSRLDQMIDLRHPLSVLACRMPWQEVERLHGQRFKARLQARDEAVAWLLWYNSARLHSTLAYVSPMQFEKIWLAAQRRQAN
jgi:transposase InsO family protein